MNSNMNPNFGFNNEQMYGNPNYYYPQNVITQGSTDGSKKIPGNTSNKEETKGIFKY